MSIVNMPDLDPGRCRNYRDGERCLDYEGTRHVCTFREPMPTPPDFHGWGQANVYTAPKPKPWVKPATPSPSVPSPITREGEA